MAREHRTVLGALSCRTHSVAELYAARLEAAKVHQETLKSGEVGSEKISGYINELADGQTAYQVIVQRMKDEGNYPWSDNEVADFALSAEICTPHVGQVEEFAGRHYAWNCFRWDLVDDIDFLDDKFIRAEFTYDFFDLISARAEADGLIDKADASSLSGEHKEHVGDACARLRKIERTMRGEGTYPWTEEERANLALASLPPNKWNGVHYFNDRPYVRENRAWVLWTEPVTDDL